MMSAPVPVRIRGVDYPSQTAAALALGVTNAAIYQALECGAIDRAGIGKKHSGQPRPCYMNGRLWPSVNEAAAGIGVLPQVISRARSAGRTQITPRGSRA
jgi:hypothetical protein